MRCPICHEEVASAEQAERWGPEFAHTRCVTAYNYGKADAAPEAPAQCDTPSYCASVQRCTADDERRASTPTQASAVDERAAFEAWYSQNAFNFERDPIGSRDCGLQWKAWQARAALAQKGGAA